MYYFCIMDVSKRIIQVREEKRIKQSEVAEKLNMERPNYSRIEKRGLKMSLEQLMQIADALGVSFWELLKDPDNQFDNPEVKAIKSENTRLKEKLADIEDDKKRLKNEIKDIQNINREHERLYIIHASLILIPFIFRDFIKLNESIVATNDEGYNDIYSLFEKLVSIDRDIHEKQYIYDMWDIRESYITDLMGYDSTWIKALNKDGNNAYSKESISSFKNEYFKFIDEYERRLLEKFGS